MKKTLVAALLALATVAAYGQGSINFSNIGSPVLLPDGTAAGSGDVSLFGATSAGALGDVSSLTPLATTTILTAGLFAGGVVNVTGGETFFRVSVSSGGLTGLSDVLNVTPAAPPSPPASLGLSSVNLAAGGVVPEPSTIALALLGGLGLLFFRRK